VAQPKRPSYYRRRTLQVDKMQLALRKKEKELGLPLETQLAADKIYVDIQKP
jgi:hypothetical protein